MGNAGGDLDTPFGMEGNALCPGRLGFKLLAVSNSVSEHSGRGTC
jgi:hypothetical protein